MKKGILFIIMLVMFGCGQDTGVEKPEKLLSEQEMTDILYDISLLQAIRSHSQKTLDSNKVSGKNYIFKKYKTDSLTFANNHKYYASKLDVYEKIQKKVLERIRKEKAPLDEAAKKKNTTEPAKTISPATEKAPL